MAKLSTLTDDFSTTTGLWGGDLAVSGGVANVVSDGNYHSAYSTARYDATDSAIAVQMTPPALTTFDTSFRLVFDGNNYAGALVVGSKLYLRVRTAGANSDILVGAYSSTAHKYLRLRDVGNASVTLDSSPDGANWVSRATASHPWSMLSVGVSLNSGSWDAATTGTATFDNVNQSGSQAPVTNSAPSLVPSASGGVHWPGEPVTVSCYATDPESVPVVTFAQTAGPPVSLVVAGQSATFIAPHLLAEAQVTIRASATDGQFTATGDITVTILPAPARIRSGGAWVPLRRATSTGTSPDGPTATLPFTDRENVTFTGAGQTSKIHTYAAGRTAGAGLVVWLHGDAAFEFNNPASTYIMGGAGGVRQVCADRGFILVSALAPDTTGTVTWWENGAQKADYVKALLDAMTAGYGTRPGRVVLAGHSGGSQQIAQYFLPRYPSQFASGGLTCVVGGGDKPITAPASWPATTRANLAMHWAAGELDTSANAADGFDGRAAATAGEAYYRGQGFARTSLQIIPGKPHDISPSFGPVLAAQLDKHLP